MYYTHYKSPFGDISLTANEQGLTSLTFIEGKKNNCNTTLVIPDECQENP